MRADPLEHKLAQLDKPRTPRQEFADTLLDRLLQDLETEPDDVIGTKEADMTGSITAPRPFDSAGAARPARRGSLADTSRRFLALAATIALVLVTSGIGFFAFNQLHSTTTGDDSPGVDNELLVATVEKSLPAALGGHWIGIERVTMAPGIEERIGSLANYDYGVYLFMLESGQLEFSATGTAGFIAAGANAGEVSELASDVPTVMNPGDRGVIHADAEAVWRSVGSEPAVILVASISIGATGSPVPGSEYATLVSSASHPWPASPASFELRRITIDGGTELPLDETPGLTTALIYIESGEIDVPLGTDDAPRTRSFGAGEEFVALVWPLRANGALENNGDGPAVLYVMTMMGAAPSGTPTT